jgi:hypothetical protein
MSAVPRAVVCDVAMVDVAADGGGCGGGPGGSIGGDGGDSGGGGGGAGIGGGGSTLLGQSPLGTHLAKGINFNDAAPSMDWNTLMADISVKHKSHLQLGAEVGTSVLRCQQQAAAAMVQHLHCPDYNSLATALMHATEAHIAPGGMFLEFDSIKMLARKSISDKFEEVSIPLYNGRLLLTNSRLLALSSAAVPQTTVTRQGPAAAAAAPSCPTRASQKARDGVWYEVAHRAADNIIYRPHNLDQFTHMQLRVAIASTTVEAVRAPLPRCCCFRCCCFCCCCPKQWRTLPQASFLENDRTFDLYVTNGPWSPDTAVKMVVQVGRLWVG